MHDVAAVPAPVALDETQEGHGHGLAVHPPTGPDPAVELLPDRPGDETGEADRHDGIRIAHARGQEREHGDHTGHDRSDELAPQVRGRMPCAMRSAARCR